MRLTMSVCASCVAPFAGPSPVDAPQIVAVVAEPAEASPGATVAYRAYVASGAGPVADAPIRWSFCTEPRPPTANTAVAQTCVQAADGALTSDTETWQANVPHDACARFGSTAPAGVRPPDADASGGYYQPVRLALEDGALAVFRHRIRCPLANVPIADVQRFAALYTPNQAPHMRRIRAFQGGREVGLLALARDAEVSFRVDFASDAAERYLRYDVVSAALVDSLERLHTRWLVNAGTLSRELCDVREGQADNRYRPDAAADGAVLWLVTSDDRGASSVEVLSLHVSEAP